jgi:hypothetical protein
MILTGILHTSLGGFTCIRGVAPLGDLARCSKFDDKYQRMLIETHREEIDRFLEDKQYLFFPEVILSASLQFNFETYKGKRPVNPLGDIFSGKGFQSNVNGLSIKTLKTRLPKQFGTANVKAPEVVYLDLPEDQLEKGLHLFRIDGNHRISAADEAKPREPRYELPTPFCIVLHDDITAGRRFEKIVFHNINAKQIPLTSEENLRIILDSGPDALFSDADLLSNTASFGPAYYLARKLKDDWGDGKLLDGIKRPLKNPNTLALCLTQFLRARDEALSLADTEDALGQQLIRLRDAVKKVNAIYEKRPKLAENGCHGVLVAFVHFALHNTGRQLAAFERWIISNRIDHLAPSEITGGVGYHYHLGVTQSVDATSLVNVFESILTSRHREIFVSMAFRDETKETHETIKKVVRQINEKHKLDIKLREIRIDHFNKGHSYTINDEILKVIEGTGLLIADLTFGNRNVYHEIGYLMGLNQGKALLQENFILIADKKTRGEELESDIGFNLKNWQQLRFDSTRILEEELTKSIEAYYQLASAEP